MSVKVTNRRCVYCGRQTKLSLACGYHRDLVKLDPHYHLPAARLDGSSE